MHVNHLHGRGCGCDVFMQVLVYQVETDGSVVETFRFPSSLITRALQPVDDTHGAADTTGRAFLPSQELTTDL